eukprot:scpid98005/ scgid29790/ TLR4 interactor with leucine rich repeats; Leucine-rich repeat-containing protein KIAA0644
MMETRGERRAPRGLSYTMQLAITLGLVLAFGSRGESAMPCLRSNVYILGKQYFQYNCSSRGYTSFPTIPQGDREQTAYLHLDNNQLRINDNQTFAHFAELRHVTLSNSVIPHLLDGTFDTSLQITNLDLSSCQIETVGPKVFSNLPKLGSLLLNQNKIRLLPPNTFAGLSPGATIALQGNPLIDDFRLCRALTSKSTPYRYTLSPDLNQRFGGSPLSSVIVNTVCNRPCNTWRPDYLKVCP